MNEEHLKVSQWKARLGVDSYYAVAKHLGMNQGTVKNCDENDWHIYVVNGVPHVGKPAGLKK
jgi:hypothetical protein